VRPLGAAAQTLADLGISKRTLSLAATRRSAFEAALAGEAEAHSRQRRCSLFLALRQTGDDGAVAFVRAAQGNLVVEDHTCERLCHRVAPDMSPLACLPRYVGCAGRRCAR
jgi:hypothetical protein